VAPILVVDDDPEIARTLRELLAHYGYPALVACSGEEALEVLEREAIDLVLLDARLPGLSGFETCERIRSTYGSSLPVVMVTAFGDREAVMKASDAGVDDLIQKPIDTPSLMLKVRAFLRLKALHDEAERSREEAQGRLRAMAHLHEIGRDWSLIAEAEEFYRLVTERLAALTRAPICLFALYDASSRVMAASVPAHGLSDEVTRRLRYEVRPEHKGAWNFRSGRPYVSNQARTDPRLVREMVTLSGIEAAVIVPMISEGQVLGLIVAANKPGGFTDADVQLLSIFAGPAATFLRSRQIFERERKHAARLEQLSDLMGALAAASGRTELLELTVGRLQREMGYTRVAFFAAREDGTIRREAVAGTVAAGEPADPERLRWTLGSGGPLQSSLGSAGVELSVPVRAGDDALGLLHALKQRGDRFDEEEAKLLTAVARQVALALLRARSVEDHERLARQMATLYDLGLETAALADLRLLFEKASQEAGRLIRADHTSVLRFDPREQVLRLFAAWARDPSRERFGEPTFKLGEGIAGRVARDQVPAIINDADRRADWLPGPNPVGRLVCVPITYYDRERGGVALFGVLNATRRPGAPPLTWEDLDYLTRFASQLSIAAANALAFATEAERREQLTLVNTLLKEIAGSLSRDRVFDTAVRRIQEAFRHPLVTIHVAQPEAGVHSVVASAGRVGEGWPSLPLASGVVGLAFREKRSVNVPEIVEHTQPLGLLATSRSQLAIPILTAGEVAAVLNVESDQPRAFDRGKVITLETLADGIGIALRNAELYQALERTNAKLVELDRTKSELVNIVAHDFRAPLSGILGHAELMELKADESPEDRRQRARAIIRSATHMSGLVEKTLKTSRLESGQFPFEFGIVDLVATVSDVAGRFPATPGHPVMTELPDDPVPCWADRGRLVEVLDNLLSNAVKYSPAGGEIHVSLESNGDAATVRIRDRGIGVAADDVKLLFKPFSRLRTRQTAEIQGSGLGLYICDRVVRAHGGRLWVESRPGEGSCFNFTLPVFGIAAQAHAPIFLIGVADEGTRREARRVAEALGFVVHEAGDGVEAVEVAVRLRPAAILLDRVLPRLGAEEVAERLDERPATASIPLFVLAPEAELGPKARRFAACLARPLAPRILAAALESLGAMLSSGSALPSGEGRVR
jgi:signal transduction histidine kinase/DNA-binding response OmpR family regulator